MGRINEHGIKAALSYKLKDVNKSGLLSSLAIMLGSTLAAQQSEPHAWLGSSPSMREWIGPRIIDRPQDFDFAIKNRKFSLFGAMPLDMLNNDKTDTQEAQAWLDDLYEGLPLQIEELLAALINNGESASCFDGQFFFDTDHSYGKSGTFSNDLTYTVGSTSVITAEEAAKAINAAIEAMRAFPDDQGRKIANRGMMEVDVIAAPGSANSAAIRQAISSDNIDTGTGTVNNPLAGQDIKINFNSDGLVTLPATKFVVARSRRSGDKRARPFAFQENKEERRIDVLDENNAKEFTVKEDAVGVAVKMVGAAGYGLPSHAVLTTVET